MGVGGDMEQVILALGSADASQRCRQCLEQKPFAAFAKTAGRPNGLSPWCRVCRAANYRQGTKGRAVEEKRQRRRAAAQCPIECAECHEHQALSEYPQGKSGGTSGRICRKCRNRKLREKRTASLSWYEGLKSQPCGDCGGRFPPECMDFDHRPGEKKMMTVGNAWLRRRATVLAEIAKCDLVCANCHRIRTRSRLQ